MLRLQIRKKKIVSKKAFFGEWSQTHVWFHGELRHTENLRGYTVNNDLLL